MGNSVTTWRSRVSLLGGVSLLTLLCSGAVAEPLLPAIDIGGQQTPDSGAASPPPPADHPQNAQSAAGPAQPAAQPLGDWPGASTTTPPLFDGSAAAGYRVKDTTAAGPIWGALPLQDTPYSVSVVSSDLIQNLQAFEPQDLAKVIPQITNFAPYQNSSGNNFFYLRGFQVTQFTDKAGVTYDGMQGGAGGMFDTVLEDKERVEVLSGVNGFLYGTGSVGGNINYVLKRPTSTDYSSVTSGDNAGGNGFIHGDFGGPLQLPGLKEGLIGYRLNVVGQTGDSSIEGQSIRRDLISAAFDFHLTDGLLVQLNAAHSNYDVNGLTPLFVTGLHPFPQATNPSNVIAYPWTHFDDQTDTGGIKVTWKINDIFTWRTAYDYTGEDRPYYTTFSHTILNSFGTMTNNDPFPSNSTQWYTNSGYSFLDADFSILGIKNKLTAGFTGYSQIENSGAWISTPFNVGILPQTNFNYQAFLPSPSFKWTAGTGYVDAHYFAKNWVVGDEIKLNDMITILAGANYTSLGNETFNSKSMPTNGYSAAGLTPTASLIFKPLPWLTSYATFQQSLESGMAVQSTSSVTYTNSGTVLPPFRGQQWEFGLKGTVANNLLLTAAFFDIDKANQYVQYNNNGTYTALQAGREVNKGIELTATGKVWDDFTIVGGATFIDPRITNAGNVTGANGNLAQYVSPLSGKIYAEYNIPYLPSLSFLKGLTLIAGWQYSSYFYNDLPNTQKIPGHGVGDLGFRYSTKVAGKDVILRLNVNNITNTAYWQSNLIEGLPRTFLTSLEVKF